jgi:hypothetical protein
MAGALRSAVYHDGQRCSPKRNALALDWFHEDENPERNLEPTALARVMQLLNFRKYLHLNFRSDEENR